MCKKNTCQKQLDFLLFNNIIMLDFSYSHTRLPVTRSCIRKKNHTQICIHMAYKYIAT